MRSRTQDGSTDELGTEQMPSRNNIDAAASLDESS